MRKYRKYVTKIVVRDPPTPPRKSKKDITTTAATAILAQDIKREAKAREGK